MIEPRARWYEAAGIALAWLTLAAATARAQVEVHGVSVTLDACVPIDHAHFAQLLEIELGDALEYESAELAGGHVASISLGCAAPSGAGALQINLELEDALTRKHMTRAVDIHPIDDSSRDRLMALTVAEFVLASWAELRLVKTETFEPAGRVPPKALERRAQQLVDEHSQPVRAREPEQSEVMPEPARQAAPQLGAAAQVLSFAPAFRFVPSGTLRLTLPTWPAFSLRLGAQLGLTSLPGRVGDAGETLELRSILASISALIMHVEPLGRFDLNVGLGVRAGIVHWSAPRTRDTSLEPASAIAAWLGPMLELGTSYRASSQLRVALMLEVGALALRPRALAPHDVIVNELKGIWTGASLGVDWEL